MKSKKLNLVRETLTQQICALLKSKIIDGELVAGSRIWADELATQLEVSIAPVKEALLILSGEGLIVNVPRRGSIVRSFTYKEMSELYDVRKLLELEALEIMFKRSLITDELVLDLQEINTKIGRLRKNGEFRDRSAAYELDWKFHERFVASCDHGLLGELYARLNTQAQIIRYSSWNIGPRGDKTYFEHDALVRALEERNIVEARNAISAHLGSILQDFAKTIEKGEHGDSINKDVDLIISGRR